MQMCRKEQFSMDLFSGRSTTIPTVVLLRFCLTLLCDDCVFKRVVPKGLDHTLSVITISLYVCVCTKVVPTGGGGGWDHFGCKINSDHS